MLVAMVTAPARPASATISASRWCNLAFNTLCGMLRSLSARLNNSLISTDVVPTNTGRPASRSLTISSMAALYFSRLVLYTKSWWSFLEMFLFVGITATSNL